MGRVLALFTKCINSTLRFLRKYIKLLIPAVLLICLIIFVSFDYFLQIRILSLRVSEPPFASLPLAQYPVLDKTGIPDISAQAAIIMDRDSKVVLYAKNADLRFSPASTTKIMTAYTALQYFDLSNILTVKREIDTQGSGLNLFKGEKMDVKNLLAGALIYSANDAAFTISQNYPGGDDGFVAKMNENARLLHLSETHFGDPAGLLDSEDYTTARELVRLASIAMQNAVFAKIVATPYATIISADGQYKYFIKNRNTLLGSYGVNGIKTGYTDEAGEVLVTSTILRGRTYYIVVMKSQDRFADTWQLLNLLVNNTTFVSMHP